MKKPIEFEPSNPNLISALTPSHHQPFQDLLLKPEYAVRKYSLPKGTSTFRILPPLKGADTWMATIASLDHGNGRHPHPKTALPSVTSVYDIAREWLQQHQPDSLYSKTNTSGHKLWSTQVTATWILIEGPEPPELRILIASDFAGSARSGASAGLAHRIKEQVRQTPALLDPNGCFQLKVTRSYSAGSRFPETHISTNQTSVPLNDLLGRLNSEDLNLVRPINETIRQIDLQEEWTLLAKVIGEDLVRKVQADTAES